MIPVDNYTRIQYIEDHQVLGMIFDSDGVYALREYLTIEGKLYTVDTVFGTAEEAQKALAQ